MEVSIVFYFCFKE